MSGRPWVVAAVVFLSLSAQRVEAQQRREREPNSVYAERRAKLASQVDAPIILWGFTGREEISQDYVFAQEENFYYLTGHNEEGAGLILLPPAQGNHAAPADASLNGQRGILFLPPKSPDKEKWNGVRMSSSDPGIEARTGFPTRAIDLSLDAQLEAMKMMRPGLYEYQVSAKMVEVHAMGGSEREGYAPIVGAGPNSTALHYDNLSRKIENGEIVVLDVGAQYSGYSADITRTLPAGGRFTARQREIYEIVLGAQNAALAALKPGAHFSCSGKKDGLMNIAYDYINSHGKDREGRPLGQYFIHGLGHHIGLNVHDPGDHCSPLQPGMVVTVEPGIYIPEENLGVRIEDDVLVTDSGYQLLSERLPRDPDEIERIMAEGAKPHATGEHASADCDLNASEGTETAEEIKNLIAKYATSVSDADAALASQIWWNSPEASFIHPLGHEQGFEQIKQNVYTRLMGGMFSERKLSVHDVAEHLHRDAAVAEFYWDFTAKLRKDGSPVTTRGRETQVYRKMPDGWRLVHVHYSGMPVN